MAGKELGAQVVIDDQQMHLVSKVQWNLFLYGY
jgi:hypothetical protein